MTVTDVTKNAEQLTLTLTADYAAPPERVWQVWADPRLLERWWGPPTWPATFVDHDLVPDGRATYYMTGPAGEQAHGWWRFLAVAAPHSLEFEDGFADQSGVPQDSMPTTRALVRLVATDTGTRMTVSTRFGSLEEMEKLSAMGMVEGMTLAAGQIDEILGLDAGQGVEVDCPTP